MTQQEKGHFPCGIPPATAAALLLAFAAPAGAQPWDPTELAEGNFRSGGGFSFRVDFSKGWPVLSHNTQRLPLKLYRGETNRVFTIALADGAAPRATVRRAWDHQRADYVLPGGGRASVIVSRLTPAVLVESTARTVTLIGDAAPKYLAFVRGGRPVVTAPEKLTRLSGAAAALDEPWLLMWFGSASGLCGWAEPVDVETELGVSKLFFGRAPPAVDLPVLLRLEHRLASIAPAGGGGLRLTFADRVGKLAILPPMGGRVLLPKETESWAGGLPKDVLAQCRLWSAKLRDVPLSVTESFAANAEAGALTVRQRFRWASFADDWKSPPVKAAPVPPVLALALGGKVDVKFLHRGRVVRPVDYRLMDTPGKAMAIEGADAYEYRIAGLNELVRRRPGPGQLPPAARALNRKLERHVQEMIDAGSLRPLLYIYGGIGGTWFSHYYWASTAELAEALAAAHPYLSKQLQARVLAYLKDEWRRWPPLSFDGRRYTAGRLRTPYEFPWNEMRQVAFAMRRERQRREADFFHELYGVEAYLGLTGEDPPAGLRTAATKLAANFVGRQDWAIMGPSRLREVRDRHSVFYYNLQGAATYNRWLAGAIGFTRLARRFGWKAEEPLGWYLVGKLAIARVAHARYVAQMHRMGLVRGEAKDDNRALLHIDPTCAVVGRGPLETGVHQNQELPPFNDLTEEVGRLLGRAAREECKVYLDQLDRSLPLWYLSEAPKQQATEHRTSPLQNLSGNVLAQYWILGRTGEAFARYVDTTRFTGDLYYVRNLAAALDSFARGAAADEPVVHSGMCDASAGVALDANTFLVADDEQNVLNAYRRDRPGGPVASFRWDRHLGIDPGQRHGEADIEGAARLGGRIYWISSHGRNREGKWRPNRHRFFATTVTQRAGRIVLRPFGQAHRRLAFHLVRDEKLDRLKLDEAVGRPGKQALHLAPKAKGLNIEGLCAAADGKRLLIAFRNPNPGGEALVVPLNNPAAVLADRARPELGEPILWKLTAAPEAGRVSLGIRSIAWSKRHSSYLIVAGARSARPAFAIYKWSGRKGEQPKRLERATKAIGRLRDFTPEALIVYPHTARVQVLSDDGSRMVKVASSAECAEGKFRKGWCQAKHLIDDRRKTFRSMWIDVE